MKRLLVLAILVLIAAPGPFARKKKAKTGTVKDGVFTDAKHNFSLSLPEGWRYKTQKSKSNYRLILTQRQFEIPSYYIDAPDYTYVPKIVIWTDTTSHSPFDFVDSLLSETHSSEQKKDIFKEFEILYPASTSESTIRDKVAPRRRKVTTIAGQKGIIWKGKVIYRKEVALSSSSSGGKRIIGAWGGAIVAVKKDDLIVMFHVMCEWENFENIVNEAMAMITTLKWAEEAEEGKEGREGKEGKEG